MRDLWNQIEGQTLELLVALAAVGVVGLLIWNKIFGNQTATAVVTNTIQGATDIANGLPGLISDTLTGTNDSTYITPEQARANDAAALAAARAAKGL